MRYKRMISVFVCFALLLFIGNRDVYGLTCKKGEAGCTEDAIEKELNEQGRELACLYEVTRDTGIYYTYIYSSNENSKKEFGIGSTTSVNLISGKGVSDHINNYDELSLNKCPLSSSFIYDAYNDYACFDNNGECAKLANSGKWLFLESNSSKLVKNNLQFIIFKETDTYKNYIDRDGFCVYYEPESAVSSWIVYYIHDRAIFYRYDNEIYNIGLGAYDVGNYNVERTYTVTDNNYRFKLNFTSNSCPNEIYYVRNTKIIKDYNYYISDQYLADDTIKDKNRRTYVLRETSEEPAPNPNPADCTLFDDDLREMINSVMDIVRVAIPLLLIGLIGLDFGKATFASDDKAISKAKKNAITRIIVAIVIYFVPILLNLIFNIANDVWADVHYEVCVLNENNENGN